MKPALFEPLTLRGMEFRNRLWIAPMCQYEADEGRVGAWHVQWLGSLAAGGAGLVIAEATAVLPEGRISTRCPGLWDEATAESWRPAVAAAHRFGAKVGIQLAHAGRKASRISDVEPGEATAERGGWQVVGPSANAFEGYPTARALELEEVRALPAAFAAAASRAVAVGFDVLELHAAHGYLLHQFLSPLINERLDEYGGSLENRCRLLVDCARAVREAVGPEVPLFVRISATDWAAGGWDLDQSVQLSKWLGEVGIDLIDVSTGGAVAHQQLTPGPLYQVPFAAAIRERAGVPTAAVGMINEPAEANEVVAAGQADAVLVARAAIRNPNHPWAVAEALGYAPPLPHQFERGRKLH